MSHIATKEYIWSFDHLHPLFCDFWEDHFRFLDAGYDGLRVEIEYSFTAGYPAKTDGPPERCYPGQDDEVEIMSMVATVPYSSDGAKAEHYDAYPPINGNGSDGMHNRSAQEFCSALLGAWEAWIDNKANMRTVEAWLLHQAAEAEADMAMEAELAMAETMEEMAHLCN